MAAASRGVVSADADPESQRHVGQFWIFFLMCRDGSRLQRHAADGAGSRLGAHDLRMHRAGVFDPRALADVSGSSAMPHFGHGTGFDSRTSGHIGQT